MNLNGFKRFFKELSYMRSMLKKYGKKLAPGKYFLFPSMRALSSAAPNTLALAKTYFDKTNKKGRQVKLLSFLNKISFFFNRNNSSSPEYEALYSANNYDSEREVKLFSFKKRKILTVCTDIETKNNQLSQYETFGKAYPMPKVCDNSDFATAYEISMISLLSRPSESLALEEIAKSTAAYNAEGFSSLPRPSVRDIIAFDYEDEEINRVLSDISSQISPSFLDEKLPLCLQHGDLSRDNLIFGSAEGVDSFWWIDWEHNGERVFFYDFFFYILNTYTYYHDSDAFEFFSSEESNVVLKAFFNFFGIAFNALSKKDYFLTFAISFLKERVCDLGNVNALKMYHSVITRLFSQGGKE